MLIAHVVFIIMGVVFGIATLARCYLMCCRPTPTQKQYK